MIDINTFNNIVFRMRTNLLAIIGKTFSDARLREITLKATPKGSLIFNIKMCNRGVRLHKIVYKSFLHNLKYSFKNHEPGVELSKF